MIFLIEYYRKAGTIVSLATYDDSEISKAKNARLNLELELNRNSVEHEVSLFQAESLEDLKQSHSRYFNTLEELLNSPEQESA